MTDTSLLPGKKYAPQNLGRVLILGLGKSGLASAQYCLKLLGSRVESLVVAGGTSTPETLAWAEEAQARGAQVYFDSEEVEGSFDVCIVSPGISNLSPFYQAAIAASREVIGEVEFAWRESNADARWVAVTGTNGKTTTTALITHILCGANFEARAVGNIGDTCIQAVEEGITEVYVAETSSFQLASTIRFAPDVAVVLNITPDHVKWHGSFEAYAQAKWNILAHLGENKGIAVLNTCDEVVRTFYKEQKAQGALNYDCVPIGNAHGIGGDMRQSCGSENAAFRAQGGRLIVAHEQTELKLVFVDDLQIKGEHNQVNALAAASCALSLGATLTDVVGGLLSFAPLEHRIEPAGEVAGVACYNDSKATNVDATLVALTAFLPQKPVVLLGGRDKGTNLEPLVEACKNYTSGVVCFGEAGPRFLEAFRQGAYEPLYVAATMEEALDVALSHTSAGDIVVLTPACASFDEFSCFEERGEVFKQLVKTRAEAANVEAVCAEAVCAEEVSFEVSSADAVNTDEAQTSPASEEAQG
jgi:UDP-N-acetylmuramoylalanine--D-glutamate ligase